MPKPDLGKMDRDQSMFRLSMFIRGAIKVLFLGKLKSVPGRINKYFKTKNISLRTI